MTASTKRWRIILPLDGNSDDDRLLVPATVLSSWFGAPLQLVTSDESSIERYAAVADGLGIPIAPIARLAGENFAASVADHAGANSPSICVAMADRDGRELARVNPQATFLMADRRSHRLASGPLVVPLTGRASDVGVLAQAAAWAKALELQIRLVVDANDVVDDETYDQMVDQLGSARERLEQMTIDVAVDHLHGHGIEPIVLMASSRSATAVVVAAERVNDALVAGLADEGVSVLVAPGADGPASTEPDLAESGPRPAATPLIGGDALDHEACTTLLARQSVGRLGYIDDGWPIVVPVNFSSTDDGLIFRSLPGAKLLAARRGDIVCLEVDHIDPRSRSGWSVLVHGPLEVITDPQALRLAWENDPQPWVEAKRWEWLLLRPLSTTGRTVS